MPDHPRLYVLGCFARYVTVYAQQVRAFNLVDTLARSGHLSKRSEVAIIGGGIAGLTAAAAFAVRGVGRVAVFEKLGNTLRIQRGTDKRFIHPHIYDWPAAVFSQEDEKEERAGHDVLDWAPGSAGSVVEELDRQWGTLRSQYSSLETPRSDCGVVKVRPEGSRWAVEVDGESAGVFDVAVLAVGFGRDSVDTTESYWTDTSLDGLEVESGGTWFLSGHGDGGLTDLMRLCIMDFRHRAVLEKIDQATREKVGRLLLEAEQAGSSPEALAKVFRDAAEQVRPALDSSLLKKRKLGRVLLNCPSEVELFSGRSSILNRLIVAYLLIEGRFELFGGGRIKLPLGKTEDGRPLVVFEEGREPFPADHVILRHGPRSALAADFPEIYGQCRTLEETWKSARQHEDWTREPLYSPGDFKPGLQPRLRLEFSGKIGCVVITGSTAPAGLSQQQRVAAAMQILRKKTKTKYEVDPQPLDVPVAQAFSSPAAYEWTVRALCDSDIAVFDITGYESAVMLLLGIRAAVRRGVTLTISQSPSPGRFLPFNLAALNPITLGEDSQPIADAMETGLASLTAQKDSYLDLPVFDAVRDLGEDYREVTPDKQILVLRWFDDQYRRLVRPIVQAVVVEAIGQETAILTTLDSSSPQLVSQRLYAAIRRTRLCLADWTGWRPNVFFEIGVRLAVNPADPVLLLCRERPPGWKDSKASRWLDKPDMSAELLKRFFQPVEFTFSDYPETLKEILEPRPRGMLSPGRTYRVICESIRRSLEPGGQTVDELLLHQAGRIAGPPAPEKGDFPLLYSEVLKEQARSSSVEMLLAAWHYLDRRDAGGGEGKGLIERVRDKELMTTDPGVARLRKVGQELSGRLRSSNSAEHRKIRTEVLTALAALTEEEEEESLG